MGHHDRVTTLADLVDPAKLSALRDAIGPDEAKDVSTSSAPPQTTSGFGGGEDLGVVARPHACSKKECKAAGSVEKDGKWLCAEHAALAERKDDAELEEIEFKGDAPIEHKNDAGTAVIEADDDTGLVTAIVSVTGIRDRVDDIIEPGAYEETLASHEPIGVWSHDDKTWVARCEEAKELRPGDPFFTSPAFLEARKGKAWPREAGALLVKSRFNLETPHGAAAYSDVKFFKGKTGWSIGYRVKKAVKDVRAGVRRIKSLSLFEFSPVMVGAAADSMTLSVKSMAQPVDHEAVPDAPEFDLEVWDAELVSEYATKRAAFLDAIEEKVGGLRRVRTPEGVRHYGEPVGSIIKPDGPGGMEGPLRGLTRGQRVGVDELDYQHHAPKDKHDAGTYSFPSGHKMVVRGDGSGQFVAPTGETSERSAEQVRDSLNQSLMRYHFQPSSDAANGVIPPLHKASQSDVAKGIKGGTFTLTSKGGDRAWVEGGTQGLSYDRVPDGEHAGKWHGAYATEYGETGGQHPHGWVTDPELHAALEAARKKQKKADEEPLEVKDLLGIREALEAEVIMLEEKAGRHVRTPGGAKLYGKPIGSLITAGDVARVKGEVAKTTKAPDAGQGPGTTKPGEVQAKTPPTAERARNAAASARAKAKTASTPEDAALLHMEADVLERFASQVDTEDAARYDKPGADPIDFHGGQPTGIKRILKNRLPSHLKKAEAEAVVAIAAVEAATFVAFSMGAGEHSHIAMAVAVGTHLFVGAAAALKEAIKEEREARKTRRADRKARLGKKALFDDGGDQQQKTSDFMQAVVDAVRDEWDAAVDSGKPFDDAAYDTLINNVAKAVREELGEGPGDPDEAADEKTEPDAGKGDMGTKSDDPVDTLLASLDVAVGDEPTETKTRCDGCGSSALLASGTCALCGRETKAAAAVETAEPAVEVDEVPVEDGATLFGTPDEAPSGFDLPSAAELDDPELEAAILNTEAELIADGYIELSDEVKATMTHEPLGTPGGKQNWVDKTGQLPAYIQHIAKDLHEERGMDLSRAIATAISMCKKWAAGGKDVKPETRAKAAAAIAEWEALKAKNKARSAAKDAGIDLTWFDITDAAEWKMYGTDHEFIVVDSLWKAEQLYTQLYTDVDEVKLLRHVRTPEGAREFRKPIGSVITEAELERAKQSAHGTYGKMRAQMAQWDAETGQHHSTEHPSGPSDLNARREGVLARLHNHGPDGKKPAGEPEHTHSNAGPSMTDPVMKDEEIDRLIAASRAKGLHDDVAALEAVKSMPPEKRYARLQMYRHGQWKPGGTKDAELELEHKGAGDPGELVRIDESELLAARRLALAID